jgi:hypothetical protein
VVEYDDPKGSGLHGFDPGGRSLEIAASNSSSLIAPGSHRAQPHHLEARSGVDRIHAPVALERLEWMQHPCRGQHRDVVIPRDDQERWPEGPQVGSCRLVLVPPTAMREVAARDDEIRRDARHELADRPFERWVVEAIPRAEMHVGHVEDAR